MKQLFLGLGLLASFGAMAQMAQTGTPVALLQGTHSQMYYPVLSADGSMLLFSSVDYSNLRIYDYASGATAMICTEARSGVDAQFTADGKEVVYVSQRPDDKGRNMRTLRKYDVVKGANTTIGEPARFIDRPALSRDGGIDATVNGARRKVAAGKGVAVRTHGSTLYIVRGDKETALQPAGECAGYLWESLSPDGTKVMFVAAGKGIFITDLEGNVLSRLGNYESPVWYGNDHIVAMHATDDGHQYSSSQIVLLAADGSAMQELTRPESMTMYPTASFAAQKIVYGTIDGRLYQMSITLK